MPETQPKKRGALVRLSLVGLVVVIVGVGLNELVHWFNHVYEPNAKVMANFIVLSSSVNGNIEAIHVREGELVKSGAQLASMDANVAELKVKSLEADLERERAARGQVQAELDYFKTELAQMLATARESVKLRQRERGTLQKRYEIARANVERNNKLLNQSVVARKGIDDANDKLLEITSKLRDLETEIRLGEKRIDELVARQSQASVYRSRLAVLASQIDKTAILLQQSRQELKDMHIYSPIDGVVNEVRVERGSYVEDGDPVFLMHDPKEMWIEANIDESDIRHVRVGQSVLIDLDAYPFEHFTGTVESIGKVTLAMMADDQSRKNGARSVQKIPVTIALPPIDKAVWPGMRASVNIVIR